MRRDAILALAILGVAGAATAGAQFLSSDVDLASIEPRGRPPSDAGTQTPVTIAFAPPLDTTLRFRVTQSQSRNGSSSAAVSWVEELRFVQSDAGYTLYWRIDGESLPPEMRTHQTEPMMRPFVGPPIAFEMSAEGQLLKVQDWGAVRKRLLETMANPAVIQETGESRAKAEGLAAFMAAMLKNMSAEQAVGMILKTVAPALRWGGLTMRPGESRTDRVGKKIAFADIEIPQLLNLTMGSASPGTASVTLRTEVDRDALAKAMPEITSRMDAVFGLGQNPKKASAMAEIDNLRIVEVIVATIDISTGLPTTLGRTQERTANGTTVIERLSLEWLR